MGRWRRGRQRDGGMKRWGDEDIDKWRLRYN